MDEEKLKKKIKKELELFRLRTISAIFNSNMPETDYMETIRYDDVLTCINELESENAALRERLDKAIEAPCEYGDIFYRFFDCPIEMVADMVCGFRKDKDGEIYVSSAYSGSWYNIKECEFSREAAEARLAELKGEKKNG